jgi:hypothetical protein
MGSLQFLCDGFMGYIGGILWKDAYMSHETGLSKKRVELLTDDFWSISR